MMIPAGRKTMLALLAGSAALLSLGACVRGAIAGPSDEVAVEPENQNWSDQQRHRWYRASQGSRLIPETWLFALEAPDSEALFMEPEHFDRFNYLPAKLAPVVASGSERTCPTATDGPERLPIGFARDCQSDKKLRITKLRWYSAQKDRESWVGLNCAACHTNQITYAGKSYVVDGAPTLADFKGFTDALRRAMDRTLKTPAKWERFSDRVLGSGGAGPRDEARVAKDRAMLKEAFSALLEHQNELEAYNRTNSEYGHGRLDAVGHILNKVALLNADAAPIRGEPNAPVSYPFIWNAPQHDFVQWNGLVPNQKIRIGRGMIDGGALVRNTSEVVGVFADVTTREKAGLNGYASSVDVSNLIGMEEQLEKLMSPKWPREFGEPDPKQVTCGRRLFSRSCAGCHANLKRTDLTTPIVAEMTPIWDPLGLGTDPWMACNAYAYKAKGGVLTGTRDAIIGEERLPAEAPTSTYLKTISVGTLFAKKFTLLMIAAKKAVGIDPDLEVFERESGVVAPTPGDQPEKQEERLKRCIEDAEKAAPGSSTARLLAYKGRPLNGIWATAPYLHNGSVRTLYDLLLPPARRPTSFWVGNREFDPKHVGFVDQRSRVGSPFSTRDNGGIGNSNKGHDYSHPDWGDAERMALIAYMKTL